MIVLRAVRVEDTGAETELGEVRLAEVGAGVFAHSATPEGHAVIADLRERLRAPAPRIHRAAAVAGLREHYTKCPHDDVFRSPKGQLHCRRCGAVGRVYG